jgi:hypothetical protein
VDLSDNSFEGRLIWASPKLPSGFFGYSPTTNPKLVPQLLVEDTLVVLDSIFQEVRSFKLHVEDKIGASFPRVFAY